MPETTKPAPRLLTAEQRKAIEKREQAAPVYAIAVVNGVVATPGDDPAAEFMAHARADVPALLAHADAMDERLAKAIARERTLRRALESLAYAYREPCWCGIAIGNPMYKQHSQPCVDARAALDNPGEGKPT